MITTQKLLTNSAGQPLQYHAITDTAFDVTQVVLSLTIGSWVSVEAVIHREPLRTQVIKIKFDAWQPAYLDTTEDYVQNHPDWTGLSPQRPGPYHIYCLPEGIWVDPRSLVDIQKSQWIKISNIREFRAISGGWPAQNKWFHSDAKSVSQQLGLVRKADLVAQSGGDMQAVFTGNGPDGKLYWKTMDGTFIAMTANLAHDIFNSAEITQSKIFAKAEQHKAMMMTLTDPESYDFSGGWPLTYAESIVI